MLIDLIKLNSVIKFTSVTITKCLIFTKVNRISLSINYWVEEDSSLELKIQRFLF